jgi:tRNA (cytidine/uridine-2'-O-)-methyltransferase
MRSLHVVLWEPEIPQNTGNIARTCASTGASLHLIEPTGFTIDEKHLRRAGLDYWNMVEVNTYSSLDEYLSKSDGFQRIFVTKKIGSPYTSVRYRPRCSLIFGKETSGLPEHLLAENRERCVRIPMKGGARSLNLSNAAALLVYEALRQHGYPGLELTGPGLGDRSRSE